MTTSFWQIRNRSFLTHAPRTNVGDADRSLADLKRALSDTQFGGESLLKLMAAKLNVHRRNYDSDADFLAEVQDGATVEHLSTIIKEKLLSSYAATPELQQRYCDKLLETLHQTGLIWAAAQSLNNKEQVGDRGYFAGTENMRQRVNLFERNGEIIFDEQVDLLRLTGAPGSNTQPIENPDGSPILKINSRFHLRPYEADNLAYKHTDLTMHYKNDTAKALYDERSVLDKIKDFFKSVFALNKIGEFTLNNETREVEAENTSQPGPH